MLLFSIKVIDDVGSEWMMCSGSPYSSNENICNCYLTDPNGIQVIGDKLYVSPYSSTYTAIMQLDGKKYGFRHSPVDIRA